jgi:hypothetical protein
MTKSSVPKQEDKMFLKKRPMMYFIFVNDELYFMNKQPRLRQRLQRAKPTPRFRQRLQRAKPAPSFRQRLQRAKPTTNNLQPATCNQQPATCNQYPRLQIQNYTKVNLAGN